MEKILPNKERRVAKLEIAGTIIEIIALSIFAILGLVYINDKAGKEAYNNGYESGYDTGYDDGYERAQERYERDIEYYYETDAEIWERYHDCDMYGLPEYAKPYCEQESGPNA